MWDLPGPGFEPVSPALAGGFLTTAPPGKPSPFSSELISLLNIQINAAKGTPVVSFPSYCSKSVTKCFGSVEQGLPAPLPVAPTTKAVTHSLVLVKYPTSGTNFLISQNRLDHDIVTN